MELSDVERTQQTVKYDELSDADLWELAAIDPEAFGELFRRHARTVHAFCVRRTASVADADDLTSVIFMEAWVRRGGVKFIGTSSLPWLLGVANNVVRNSHRALRRYRSALHRVSVPSNARSAEDEAMDVVEGERNLRDAITTLRKLSRAEQEVVTLVLWTGLSYEEAALALGVPIGTVRSRLSRAKKKLQSHFAPVLPILKEALP
jgi:RNA polymerase sigma factor (sigma-70 family)